MHFEILVEDQSGKTALDILVPKIISAHHTFRVMAYKGVGRIPKNLSPKADPQTRALLNQLPRLLQGYGRAFAGYPADSPAAVILVCDLDEKCRKAFRAELLRVLESCTPAPETRFCIAVEEGEAWYFGDIPAIKRAYPKARDAVLNAYRTDSICGTWERLADAVCKGGAQTLSAKGWQEIGAEKTRWAEAISPYMDVAKNKSPSFVYFREKLLVLADTTSG